MGLERLFDLFTRLVLRTVCLIRYGVPIRNIDTIPDTYRIEYRITKKKEKEIQLKLPCRPPVYRDQLLIATSFYQSQRICYIF
jgi:hypothetical protein